MSDDTPDTPETPETPQGDVEQPAPEQQEQPAPEPEAVTEEPGNEPSEEPSAPAETPAAEEAPAPAAAAADEDVEYIEETPREKPEIPGMDLEVDIVLDDSSPSSQYSEEGEPDEDAEPEEEADRVEEQPITASIELAADARYRATGKRKTAVARVTLKPGTGAYVINGKTLEEFFPRDTLQRTIRQPLETVGYETKMDVVARMHGGGVSAQAGALRHGISRALLEADPNLRGELKRRGFLTRDARAKERKKAGLKKARKRPQFSKR